MFTAALHVHDCIHDTSTNLTSIATSSTSNSGINSGSSVSVVGIKKPPKPMGSPSASAFLSAKLRVESMLV